MNLQVEVGYRFFYTYTVYEFSNHAIPTAIGR